MSYAGDVAALLRKDLLLELRARETLPAMAIFVLAALTVFHFALPSGSSDLAADGLLWIAILFTALLGLSRAFVAEREQGVLDGLVMSPCDRSAIWLAKTLSALTFLVLVEAIALPAFSVFFAPVSLTTVAAVALADVGPLHRRHAARRDGRREPDARAAAPAPLPAARAADRRRRRGGERDGERRPLPRLSPRVRPRFCDHLLGFL